MTEAAEKTPSRMVDKLVVEVSVRVVDESPLPKLTELQNEMVTNALCACAANTSSSELSLMRERLVKECRGVNAQTGQFGSGW